jgi:hypothetical protein
MHWTRFALALWTASAAVAQEPPPQIPPPSTAPETAAAGVPVAEAPAVASPGGPPSFSAGVRLGLLVPVREATAGLSLGRYAPVMFELGLDLGWYPAPWLWTGLTGSLASGCETVVLCSEAEVESQILTRAGLAATARLLGGPTELWVGAGVQGAWLEAGPWELGGVELTVPRLEYTWPSPAGRIGFLAEATFGRFKTDSVRGGALPASEQTLHATLLLAVRTAWEPRMGEGVTVEGEVAEAGPGFLLSGRMGGAFPLLQPGNVAEAYLPVQLALGYRFGSRTWASAFLEVASGVAASCAPSTGCDPFRVALGLQVEYHPAPTTWRDPWIGLGTGPVGLLVDRQDAGVPVSESWDGWMVRLEGGVQLVRWTQGTLGAWASIDGGRWLWHDLDVGGATQSLPVRDPTHATLQAGLRMAWLP